VAGVILDSVLPRRSVLRHGSLLALLLTLAAPMAARAAGPPTVTAQPATDITSTAVTLNATVNPNGLAATARFLYGDNSDPVLLLLSPLGASPLLALAAGNSAVPVSARVSDLKPNTTYYFIAGAFNDDDSSADLTPRRFKTLPETPAVTTGAATDVTSTSVTLHASVTPNGGFTDATFDLSSDALFATSLPVQITDVGDGRTPVAVATTVTGLVPGTRYYYRVTATNPGGTVTGALQAVELPPTPAQSVVASAPAAPVVRPSGPASVKLSGSALTVTDGHTVTCAPGGRACTARLVVTAPASKAKKKRKPVTIAAATVKIAAGASRRLTFKLNAAGSKLLRAKGRLTATVRLTIDYGGPTTLITTHRVVLRAPKRLRRT